MALCSQASGPESWLETVANQFRIPTHTRESLKIVDRPLAGRYVVEAPLIVDLLEFQAGQCELRSAGILDQVCRVDWASIVEAGNPDRRDGILLVNHLNNCLQFYPMDWNDAIEQMIGKPIPRRGNQAL
jgi:hypothetical protein